MCTLNVLVKEELEKVKTENLVKSWVMAKEVLDTVKAIEMELRKAIVSEQFADAKIGSSKADSSLGQLTLTKGLSYKVGEAELSQLLTKFEEEFIDVGTLFKVKHELSLKEYKSLTDEQRNLVDECLTITEKAPELKIKLEINE